MSELYEDDIVQWSAEQAALLRRRGGGELVNDGALDWPNIAEEIESVGNEQVHAVRSLLMRAMEHDLKCAAWPESREVPHWRAEARRFRIEATDRFTPAMRAKIDVSVLYRRARRLLPESIDGAAPLPVRDQCPWTLEELLSEPA